MMHSKSSHALLAALLYSIQLIHSKTITWLPSGSGDLHNVGNWDSTTLPTTNDDLIINIKNNHNADTVLSLNQGDLLSAHSLTVSGKLLLSIESTIRIDTITLSDGAWMHIQGAELHSSKIGIAQNSSLLLDSVVVQGNNLQLNIHSGAELIIGNHDSTNSAEQSTATHFINTNIQNAGHMTWYTGALILDSSQLHNTNQLQLMGNILNTGSSSDATKVYNTGTLIMNALQQDQLIGLPIVSSGKISLPGTGSSGSTVKIQNNFNVESGM